jgi:dCTP diphosphatase
MTDATTTIEQLKNKMKKFVEERDWQQFHSPKNLSMAIAAEAAELMELFLWSSSESCAEELAKENLVEPLRINTEHELADIVLYILSFCSRYNIDLAQAIEKKMALNAAKYPIEKAKGKSLKYSAYLKT